MCALAAKQQGQSSISDATVFHNNAQKDIAQRLLHGNVDFLWYGVKYYDKAIKTLARQITPREPQVSHPSPSEASSVGSLPQSDMMTRAEGEDPIVRLLATCLLIQYENLSGNTKGWSGHLNGFNKLLALLDDGSLFRTNPWSQQVFDAKGQRALRAAFWWYAINDLEESCEYVIDGHDTPLIGNTVVSRRKVRIDLENISLWRHMGLHMHDNGDLVDLDAGGTPEAPPHLQGDLLSFALIRLVSKLVNFLALPQGDEDKGSSPTSSAHSFFAKNNIGQFQIIKHEFDRWIASATAAFLPDSTWSRPDESGRPNPGIFGSETWYSHSFRAVTMLYYHMARMLLLIHQPPSLFRSELSNRGISFDLLNALRDIERQMQSHATEVISITNGMLDDGAVRVRAVQPLYVAGRSLTMSQDRRRLVEMIRSLQDDFGLVCEYRVENLMQEWGITLENLGLGKRQNERRFSNPS
jgi:hypothetical protein